ncbi:MAG: ParB/RepB/Spo0J family partition protein [Acidobacteriia bacterium]|nr:ParB/RepB/Spo0J family partition protein [Terriglobia bacterium]
MYKNRNAEVRPAKEGRPQDEKKEGTDNVTTATAGHPEKDKEKVEKRRALGRGLESLLPGPRVIRPPATHSGQDTADAVPSSRATTGAEAPGSGGADAALKSRSSTVATAAEANSAARAPQAAELRSAGQPMAPPPHHANIGRGGDPGAVPTNPSSLAAVPVNPSRLAVAPSNPAAVLTNPSSLAAAHASASPGAQPATLPPAVHGATALAEHAIATGSVDHDPFGDAPKDGVIEIQAVAITRVPPNLVMKLAISDVDKNPFQTRLVDDDDALEELSDSIKANGVVQPIVVRPAEQEGRYILIMGERRLHASKKAGKTHVPALVRRVSEQQAAEMTIIENLQREDLSPMEQAESFRVLSNQFSMTQQQIADRVGLSRVSVANYMRLLKLPREVMQMLMEKRINFAKAKELLKLGDNDRIAEAALYAVKKGMNIEQVEMLVLRMDGLLDPLPDMPGVQKERKSSGARWVDPNVRSAQMDLERLLGVRVRIRDRKGKGKIVIEYSTVDDYERVVEMLRGKK